MVAKAYASLLAQEQVIVETLFKRGYRRKTAAAVSIWDKDGVMIVCDVPHMGKMNTGFSVMVVKESLQSIPIQSRKMATKPKHLVQ